MPREYREERLQRTLREEIHDQIKGVVESVIVTNDGLVVAAFPAPVSTDEAHNEPGGSHWVAALAAEIIAQSQRAFGRLAQGQVSRILVDGESGSMIVVPAGSDAALAVMVDKSAKLGIAMFQISRAAEHVGAILERSAA